MICKKCGSTNVRVIDSRVMDEDRIWRRRMCKGCGTRWTTWEVRVSDYHRHYTTRESVAKAVRNIKEFIEDELLRRLK